MSGFGGFTEEDKDVVRAVGARLRQMRHDMHLTTYEMSNVIGIPPNQLNAYENGRNAPHLATLAKIAQALNISMSALLEGV